jgi:hypothetical protein
MRLAKRLQASVVVACCAIVTPVFGQIPSISGTSPLAVAPGQALALKIRGGNLIGAAQIWSSFPATAVLDAAVPNNGKNAGEAVFTFTLPPEAPVGVHGLRVANGTGISNLWLVMVDDLPSVAQVKPNGNPMQAQVLTLPAGVDGNVDSLTRNYYKFTAAAAQTLSFEVVARRFGSALDPMLRILDLQGRELAYSDDAAGLGGDSRLTHIFKDAGEYIVEVRDIRFQGGGNFNYRLRIGDFPCVTTPYPMGVKKGAPAQLAFAGSRLEGAQAVTVNIPNENPITFLNVGVKLPNGTASGFGSVSVGSSDEALEVEPNDEPAMATRVNYGASLNGRFDKPGDVDRFVFTAKAGQRFMFTGITRQQGSPADLYLKILKADGGQVVAADDNGAAEGALDFNPPADGDYTLVVEELVKRGGPDYAYRIAVTPFQAGFDLSVSTDTLNVPLQGTSTVTVTSVRRGYDGPIELSLAEGPANVASTGAVIGVGQNSAVLTILNSGAAPDGKIYPVKILGKAKIGEVEYVAQATATTAQKAAFAATPLPPQLISQSIALGTNPQPFFVLRTEPAELVFGKNLTASVKIKSIRAADFPEAITFAIDPAQNGLPAGVTAAVKPIDKDKNEVDIVFTAAAAAPLGSFSGVLVGSGKKGNDTVVQAAPAVRFSLRVPFVVKTDIGAAKIVKGAMLKGKVVAERNPAYNGPIVLTFANLPKGVTAAEATIPEGKTEVEITLTAAADAQVGTIENLSVKGEGTAGGQKFAETAANAKLIVE